MELRKAVLICSGVRKVTEEVVIDEELWQIFEAVCFYTDFLFPAIS